MYFKVTKSLTCITGGDEIEFIGCDAEITGEISSSYFVRFYDGIPFLIGKERFRAATVATKELTNIGNMIVADITLWRNEARIKTYRGLLSPDDHEYQSVKENAAKWFKLAHGKDYDKITTEFINEVKSNNTMAKKKETEIEEAVVIEETTEALSVVEKIATSLPAIPDSFVIDGNEYSVAVVDEMAKEADKLLAKATPSTYGSKAIWDEVSTLKNKLVKMRTTPDNKRKELSKPFQDFVKTIKEKTDAVGNAAKAIQDKLDAALLAKEEHEAELARQEAEKIAKRTELRKEELRALGGVYDIDSGSFTFPHNPGTVVGVLQLQEYDDAEWTNELKIVQEAWDAEQKRIADEEAAKNAEVKAAQDALAKLEEKKVALRGKELRLEGFEFDEELQSWKKGSAVVHVLGIAGYSDEDWDALIEEANKPVSEDAATAATEPVQPLSPVAPIQPSQATGTAPTAPVFDAIGAALGATVSAPAHREVSLDDIQPVLEEGTVVKQLVFTNDNPYIDIALNKTFLRIYPDEKDFEANDGISPDSISKTVSNEELGLRFAIIKFS